MLKWVNNNIAHYEGFYAAIIYSLFNALGITAIPEDTTSKGRIDLTLDVLKYRIIMEFKLTEHGDAQSALNQIKHKGYAAKYAAENKSIYLLGISFDKQERNVAELVWEEYATKWIATYHYLIMLEYEDIRRSMNYGYNSRPVRQRFLRLD